MRQTDFLSAIGFVLCFLSYSAHAQWTLGPRIAQNVSDVVYTGSDDWWTIHPRTGLALGLAADFTLHPLFSLHPELLFTQYGYHAKDGVFSTRSELKQRHQYLQIPLLGRLNLGSSLFQIHIEAGPHLGWGVGQILLESQLFGIPQTHRESWEDLEISRFSLGITSGLGASVLAGIGRLGIDIRYQLGLGNMVDKPDGDETLRNRAIQIGLSYLVPIRSR